MNSGKTKNFLDRIGLKISTLINGIIVIFLTSFHFFWEEYYWDLLCFILLLTISAKVAGFTVFQLHKIPRVLIVPGIFLFYALFRGSFTTILGIFFGYTGWFMLLEIIFFSYLISFILDSGFVF